jgi:hypothetical protein
MVPHLNRNLNCLVSQAADFLADMTAVGELCGLLGSRLFRPSVLRDNRYDGGRAKEQKAMGNEWVCFFVSVTWTNKIVVRE